MIRALYTSASAMLFGMRQQEMAAGNLANSGTSGYKAETSAASAFSGVLARRVGSSSPGAPVPMNVGEVLGGVGTGVYQSIRGHDFADGALRDTELKLDFALSGPGFFVVQTPDGPAYTRDGHFLRSADNTLVTDQGEPVLGTDGGPITITSDNVKLLTSGELLVNDQPSGALQVVQFDVTRAVRAGSTRFIVGQGDEATLVTPGDATIITQGSLEEANVSAAGSAAQVISVARAFEASQHIFTSISETLRETVNEVGRVARQ